MEIARALSTRGSFMSQVWLMSLWYRVFSSRRGNTRFKCDWSSDVCSSDLYAQLRDNPWFTEFGPDEVIAMDLLEDCGSLELASGRHVRARLVVGADGSRSRIRELAGIESQAF